MATLLELDAAEGWLVRARAQRQPLSVGAAVEAFVRPEVATLAPHRRGAARRSRRVHSGEVQSLLFDGANSAVLLQRSSAAASSSASRCRRPGASRI